MQSLRVRLVTGCLLLACAGTAIAGFITVNGQSFVCTNDCVLHTYPAGGWMVTDSNGGKVENYNEAIHGPIPE